LDSCLLSYGGCHLVAFNFEPLLCQYIDKLVRQYRQLSTGEIYIALTTAEVACMLRIQCLLLVGHSERRLLVSPLLQMSPSNSVDLIRWHTTTSTSHAAQRAVAYIFCVALPYQKVVLGITEVFVRLFNRRLCQPYSEWPTWCSDIWPLSVLPMVLIPCQSIVILTICTVDSHVGLTRPSMTLVILHSVV